MRNNDYDALDACAQAELVRTGQVTPLELADTAIRVIEERNPALNAVIRPLYEKGRAAASGPLPDGPFKGVPFLLKDLIAAYAGEPMSCGSKSFQNYIPKEDSELVKRFKQAGLVILGKTNLPEFGLMGITEPDFWGPTRNPWNTDHTPGGSSGGSAAAVAAGMVPVAGAGDGGGSIRIPASACGLFGLKPTRGRNPVGPGGECWQGATVENVLSRSVRDSAVMLDITNGTDPGARICLPKYSGSYAQAAQTAPGKLRIAFTRSSPLGNPVHPDCLAALDDTIKLLQDLGHTVEEASPDINGQTLALSYFTLYFGEVGADMKSVERVLGRKPKKSDMELVTWLVSHMGKHASAETFVLATRFWDRAARKMAEFHKTWDLYLTPTLAAPPVRIGELKTTPAQNFLMNTVLALKLDGLLYSTGAVNQIFMSSLEKTPFTQLANLTGQPAMSVPLFWNPAGLPIGSHFTAPFGREDLLLSLAGQLEQARPWFHRRPPMVQS